MNRRKKSGRQLNKLQRRGKGKWVGMLDKKRVIQSKKSHIRVKGRGLRNGKGGVKK